MVHPLLTNQSMRYGPELALTRDNLHEAIMEDAVERVRPKIMTVIAIMAGLLPILWSTGTRSRSCSALLSR